MGRRLTEGSARAVQCQCDRLPVLCGCGWGFVSIPECRVPEFCQQCGFGFWETFGEPEPCAEREEHP
jgi:hypothetical protein